MTTTPPTAEPEITQEAARAMLAAKAGFVCLTEPANVPIFLKISTIVAIDRDASLQRTTVTTDQRTASGASLDWYVKESVDDVISAIVAATRGIAP